MGSKFSKKKEVKVVVIGYNGAGKSTFFNKINGRGKEQPSISEYFQVDFFKFKKVKLEVWDLDGKEEVLPLWRHYLANTQFVIFIVDSADRAHINDAKELLHTTFASPLLTQASLVVIANKQDLPDAMTAEEIEQLMDLNTLSQENHWCMRSCSASTGEGVQECFEWIVEQISSHPQR
ncbi:unnamed protein product [Symbiodinium microadriaticum]|nr:unnamed protein product [Symbiodinium microadriaticum]